MIGYTPHSVDHLINSILKSTNQHMIKSTNHLQQILVNSLENQMARRSDLPLGVVAVE